MSTRASFNNCVFINCPFDDSYQPLFEVAVFTILACGFVPRCAKEEADSSDVRVEKICRLIESCRYGIHDISAVGLSPPPHRLPRFNMPFELGVDVGCKKFGSPVHRRKKILVLDRLPHRYQIFLSDIAGQDIDFHEANPDLMIVKIKKWLRTVSDRRSVPGEEWIRSQYSAFSSALPTMCADGHIDRAHLQYVDFVAFAEDWLEQAMVRAT